MKLFIAAVGFATLAAGLATSADARPHHAKQCKWVVEHHHRVRHCW